MLLIRNIFYELKVKLLRLQRKHLFKKNHFFIRTFDNLNNFYFNMYFDAYATEVGMFLLIYFLYYEQCAHMFRRLKKESLHLSKSKFREENEEYFTSVPY